MKTCGAMHKKRLLRPTCYEFLDYFVEAILSYYVALIKFFENEEYANAFVQRGQMYCQTLKYFKEIEDKGVRSDAYEGVSHSLLASEYRVKWGDLDLTPALLGEITIHPDRVNYYNLFCMYSVLVDEREKTLQEWENQLNQQVLNPRLKEFGQFAVIVKPKQFFEIFDEYIKSNRFQAVHRDRVKYYDVSKTMIFKTDKDIVFSKRKEYAWQQEYRFMFDINDGNKPVTIEIGSLKEISTKMTIEHMCNTPFKLSPKS